MCENSTFENILTIPINLIQLHYFDDVINEFNLIDLKIRCMNCDSCFKRKQKRPRYVQYSCFGKIKNR